MSGSKANSPQRARDARQVRSAAALRVALLSLITRQPYDKITVRDIVAEAGIGYATFFRHYPGKDALLDAVAGEEIAGLLQHTAPLLSPADTRTSSIVLTRLVGERREVWKALLTGGASTHLREQFVRFAGQVPAPDMGSEWLPHDLGLIFGVSATVEILAWWLWQSPDLPPEDVAELLDRLVVTPTVGSLRRN